MLVINVLYSAKSEVLSVFFPCFIPEYDAVLHALKIAKMDCSFSPFTRFWAFYEASYPHFSALEPLKLHLCTLVPMPGIPVYHTPNHHLGCPILPFGISHFAFWGIPFYHLGYIFGTFAHNVQPDFRFVFFVFVAKVCVFLSFRFIMFFMIHLAG